MSALLFNRPLNVRRREESQTSRRLCLTSAIATFGWMHRLVGQRSRSSVMRTIGDKEIVSAIILMVEINPRRSCTMLTSAAEPAHPSLFFPRHLTCGSAKRLNVRRGKTLLTR
jgi:hypothetical protein